MKIGILFLLLNKHEASQLKGGGYVIVSILEDIPQMWLQDRSAIFRSVF